MVAHPRMNSSTNAECTELTLHKDHNIGIAMDTPRGLLVPNVKHCEQKSVLEIAQDLNRLQELGATNMLGPADMNGGTITLSNVGKWLMRLTETETPVANSWYCNRCYGRHLCLPNPLSSTDNDLRHGQDSHPASIR